MYVIIIFILYYYLIIIALNTGIIRYRYLVTTMDLKIQKVNHRTGLIQDNNHPVRYGLHIL
jgi:hypothetical protein